MSSPQTDADVVVIGAGLSGLVAARDLSASGRTVLVLEASQQPGGRTFADELPGLGVRVEMGGTWILEDDEPAITAELQRYGLELEYSPEPERFVFRHQGRLSDASSPSPSRQRELAAAISEAVSVEGSEPTVQDVLDGLESDDELRTWIRAWTNFVCGAPPEKVPAAVFRDVPAEYLGAMDMYSAKLHATTDALIAALIADAGVEPQLGEPVLAIDRRGDRVEIQTSRRTVTAAAVLLAVPVNTWSEIRVTPAFDGQKKEVIETGHCGRSTKVWIVATGLETAVRAVDPDGGFSYLRTDRVLPDGRSVLVGFTCEDELAQVTTTAVQVLVDRVLPEFTVDAVHSFDFNESPFFKGAWASYTEDISPTRYAVAEPPLFFAGADIAENFGTIEGAVVSGAQAAEDIDHHLTQRESAR
ncbi:flavin monoamine oxidase family protein [Catenulispora rubra]|uniref:flavin monoamine oxidase family protein n=1 Tax=Catenulispora rubra TaxID=280293 RepID=UPI0018928091|nr:NAD(P)/FAD-dependent oxidoreductase [Catenulispora rubra]